MDHFSTLAYCGYPSDFSRQKFDSPAEENCCVLDLSKKITTVDYQSCRVPSAKPITPSPDYTYHYPSPKSSPTLIESPTSTTDFCVKRPRSVCESDASENSFCSSDITNSPKSKRMMGSRPFKAFPKHPLDLLCSDASKSVIENAIRNIGDPSITKFLIDDSLRSYEKFRQEMMQQINNKSEVNKNMRRNQMQSEKCQDVDYLEKRRKNNEAAKRSRDARRIKQDEIAIRLSFLEKENMMLKCKIEAEKEHIKRLKKSLENNNSH